MRTIPARFKGTVAVLLSLLMLLVGGLMVVAQSTSTSIWGNVTFGSANATGAVVEGFIGSSSTANASVTAGGQGSSVPTGYYQVDVACDNSTAVFVKVWGINGTAQGCILGGRTEANISVSLLSNDAACTYDNACTSGICCSGGTRINGSGSGTCAASCSSSSSSGSGGGSSSSSSSSSGGGGGSSSSSSSSSSSTSSGGPAAPKAPAAPSQKRKEQVTQSLPESLRKAPASDLAYETTKQENQPVVTSAEDVEKTLADVETIVTTERARQAVTALRTAVSGGGKSPVRVDKRIEVVKVTNTKTSEVATVSVVELTFTPGNDAKDVEIMEVIPKAAASDVSQVTFLGEKPEVLQADPVVQWNFAEVKRGQTKDLSYSVNKDISTIGTTTAAAGVEVAAPADAPEVPEKSAFPLQKISPVGVLIAVVIVLGGLAAYYVLVQRKKRKK